METINRMTRGEYSKLIKSILDGEITDDRFVVEEVDGGYEMTVSESSGSPVPVLCGSYHGGIIARTPEGASALPVDDAVLAEWRAAGVNEERILDFVISTGAKDRYGDVVRPTGLKKRNFRRNPVVLWAHEYYGLPIAKSLREMREGKEVKGSAEFIDATLYEFADTVFRFYRSGFLNAVSIGFQPIKKKVIKDEDDPDSWWPKYDFVEWDLLEYSAVPVPANPEAIIDAKSAGIEERDLVPYRSWLERHIESCESGSCRRGIASRRNVETTWSKLYGKTSATIVVPSGEGSSETVDLEVPAGVARAVDRLQTVVKRFEGREIPDELRDDVKYAGELLADVMAGGLGLLKTGDADDPPEDWREKFSEMFVTDEDFKALIARVDALEDYVADAKDAADPGSSPRHADPADDGSSPDGGESTEGASAAEAGEAVEQIFSEE